MTYNPLTRIPVITKAILDAQPLDKHVEQLNHLEGLTFMAQKIGATLEAKNDIGDALVRICRNAGQRFIIDFPRGGDGSNQYTKKEQSISKKRLAKCGFNDWRANVCRKIAALPEDIFEDLILNIRLGEHKEYTEINMSNFRKAGELHIMRMAGINTDRPVPQSKEVDIDIELARHMYLAGLGVSIAEYQSQHSWEIDATEQEIQDAIEEYKATKREKSK